MVIFISMAKKHRIDYEKYIKDLMSWLNSNGLKLTPFPTVKLSNRVQDGVFISTGNYDPDRHVITLFVNGRHIKDVLRTLAHECVHHNQNLEGRLVGYSGTRTSEDETLTGLEEEAYKIGNIMFRNWTEEKTKSEKPEKSFSKHMKKKITVDESLVNTVLNEEIEKKDVKSMIDKAVSDFLSSNDLQKKITNITADVVEEFIDNLFTRKAFWKGIIRRN